MLENIDNICVTVHICHQYMFVNMYGLSTGNIILIT